MKLALSLLALSALVLGACSSASPPAASAPTTASAAPTAAAAAAASTTVAAAPTGWMSVARLVRGNVRDLLQVPYVDAAHALGASSARVIWKHLLPNTAGVLCVASLVQLNRAILTEATISFLGMGIQPPEPTRGNLLIGAQNFLYSAPWLAIEPGLAITLTLLAVYSLGMGRALSPASR